MKKLFIIAAVSIASASAFASKARENALQSAAHVQDIQDVVGHNGSAVKPSEALNYGDTVTLEFGSTSGATTNAEGGFVRKGEDSAWGAYLGNKADNWTYYYGQVSSTTYFSGTTAEVNQANPLDLFYAAKAGDMNWGLGLHYVSNDFKNSKFKENVMALYGSASSSMGWDVQLGMGLGAEATDYTTAGSEIKIKGGSSMSLTGGYKMDTMYVYAGYKSSGAKYSAGSTDTADRSRNTMLVGVINSMKKDGAEFFYGAEYNMDTQEQKIAPTSKTEATTLPVIMGLEAEANSWLTLRGSLKQNVFLGSTKTSGTLTPNADANSISDNTVVAAGVGLKFGKATMDATLASANKDGGAFGTDAGATPATTNNFLATLGMTYAW